MELISLREVSQDSKLALLRELGYESDGEHVLKDGQPVSDPFTGDPITLDNMVLLPGSTVLTTDNEVSIASYFEEYGDWD